MSPGAELRERVRADLAATGLSRRSVVAKAVTGQGTVQTVLLYRLSWWLARRSTTRPLAFVVHRINQVLNAVDLHPDTDVGGGFHLSHGIGIVMGAGTSIGRRCHVYHQVTFGARGRRVDGRQMPIVGDDVTIYAGGMLLGPITVGDGAVVGAAAVVLGDVAPGASVVGNPARALDR